MNKRQQLIEELEQAPDDVVQKVLEFLHQIQVSKKEHPLAKFVGILSDAEAEEMQQAIRQNCRQVDGNEW
ncbi:hypothetical protein PN466_05955 [Roseofilum reptotaenium CS-1145]|uniref:DUF2281 domain-containing protein n=1 Tax=Roseofilum reptotaenium AO1-A TaxID=1925591 RepID=A0A1L9QME7_9CYAN|nr:hypothetical protein [Roseofilum reptotaenium]MDB9516497.1 hypothetical protein [Roseofilum reptotaenium CS-1145]OJJ22251.1 hypothetical protein BI308_19725 [Roseofilum reptotaenium AO1-A]